MKKLMMNAVAIAATLCGTVHAASPSPYSAMWVFGGPLEDVGNYASVHGDLPPPFFQNRFSDGPLAVEILAGQLGFELTPSLHRVGPVQGNNFASADALASGPGPQDLGGQIEAYFSAAPSGKADPNALYYMIIGGNEVIAATYEADDAKSLQYLSSAVNAKRLAIERLATAGARNLFVDNFFNLGSTPQLREAGLAARATRMSKIHNVMMEKMLDQAERRFRIHLIRFDVYDFGESVIAGSNRIGLTNTTDSCLAVLPAGKCDFQNFVFFNDLFVTARVGELWGFKLTQAVLDDALEAARCGHRNRKDVNGIDTSSALHTGPAHKRCRN